MFLDIIISYKEKHLIKISVIKMVKTVFIFIKKGFFIRGCSQLSMQPSFSTMWHFVTNATFTATRLSMESHQKPTPR